MSGIMDSVKDMYIRFLVWLGAEPPPGYEYLIGEEAAPREYTLKEGDTLYSVARRFGVHYNLIAQANNIEEPAQVKSGQTLLIPAPDWTPPKAQEGVTPPPHVVKETPVQKLREEVAPPVETERPASPKVYPAPPVEEQAEEEPEWLIAPRVYPAPSVEERVEEAPGEDFEWLQAGEAPSEIVEAPPEVETPSRLELPVEKRVEAAPPPESEMVFRYEMQRGDTLSGIARKYGITVKDLVEANNIVDPSHISPGQKLVIPGYMEPKAAPQPEAPPITRPLPEIEERFVYTIASGDTLNGIAKRYSLTVRELLEANQIENPSLLRVGQKLVIPGVVTPLKPAAPPPVEAPLPSRPLVFGTDPNFPPLGPKDAVRGMYASYFAIGHNEARNHIFELLESTELNSIVIDAKGDFGWLSYATQIPLAREVGATRPVVKDLDQLLHQLKSRGVYTIARIVAFKDNPLAKSHPELAVKTGGGAIWQDGEGVAWVDPFLKPVWDYNIGLAIEAAQLGFDEVLFDYVRFPLPSAAGAPQFSQEATRESRVTAITGFLSATRGQLEPLGVKIAADVSGYTCWRKDDATIGQDLERMGQYLDVLCPVLHPSTFSKGIPGYKVAVAHPYEVVYHSAKQAVDRLKQSGCAVRPWIQDFPDYRFDKRVYGKEEIQAQIRGCFESGAAGFMVWDPQVKYTREAYAPATIHQTVAG